jgi:hypothetical protein
MPPNTELLKQACLAGYDNHTNSCSHAVWHIYKAIVNSNEPYRVANELITHMTARWEVVTLERAHQLANQGLLAVGGAESQPNGHVIVVYPGELTLNGGYQYLNKKTNKLEMLQGKKKYPLCMSASNGSWPGAKSRGTKTVWDPWGKDSAFEKVRFWTPPLPLYVNPGK